jgi:hypothetical protein
VVPLVDARLDALPCSSDILFAVFFQVAHHGSAMEGKEGGTDSQGGCRWWWEIGDEMNRVKGVESGEWR